MNEFHSKRLKQKHKRLSRILSNRKYIQGRRIFVENACVRGLYKLYDITGKVVYIGISKNNVLERICAHFNSDKEFDSFSIKSFDDLTDLQLEELEIKLIKRYRPKYNIAHNNDEKYHLNFIKK